MHTPNRRSTTTETVFSHKCTKQVCVFLKHQIYSQKKWWVKTSKDDSSILNSRIILFGREQQYIGGAWIYMLLSHIGAIKNTTLKINIIQSSDSSEMRNLSFWIAPVNAELYCFFGQTITCTVAPVQLLTGMDWVLKINDTMVLNSITCQSWKYKKRLYNDTYVKGANYTFIMLSVLPHFPRKFKRWFSVPTEMDEREESNCSIISLAVFHSRSLLQSIKGLTS